MYIKRAISHSIRPLRSHISSHSPASLSLSSLPESLISCLFLFKESFFSILIISHFSWSKRLTDRQAAFSTKQASKQTSSLSSHLWQCITDWFAEIHKETRPFTFLGVASFFIRHTFNNNLLHFFSSLLLLYLLLLQRLLSASLLEHIQLSLLSPSTETTTTTATTLPLYTYTTQNEVLRRRHRPRPRRLCLRR
jgi:hypothetical protein